jgi:hypothetical protein
MDINQLKKTRLLEVFNLITTHGNKIDGSYELSNIRASHDFDGYTCWMAYKDLTITLLFHGQYSLDYKEEKTVREFTHKVLELLEDKSNKRK